MAIIETTLVNSSAYVPVALDPVVNVVQTFFKIVSALLGGLFGLYFIYLVFRYFYDRKVLNEIRALRRDVRDIRKKLKIK